MNESSSPPTAADCLPEGHLPSFPYRFMAVDVGSNATKYRAWEVEADGAVHQLAERRFAVQLGHGVFSTGLLDAEGIEATVDAFRQIQQDAARLQVRSMRAVATSAMREASNSQMLVDRLAHEVTVNLEVLPDIEEARLIALGVLDASPKQQGQTLLIDIGGGSTEVILAHDRVSVSALSLRVGAVRLKEMFFADGRPDAGQLERAEAFLHDVLNKTLFLPALGDDPRCVGSAGTITTLHLLAQSLPGHDSSSDMTLDDLELFVEEFKRRSVEEIGRDYPIAAPRAEILLPGALILRTMMRHLRVRRLGAVRAGVSDGLLHVFLERMGLRGSCRFECER